jgi:hypothetical protein
VFFAVSGPDEQSRCTDGSSCFRVVGAIANDKRLSQVDPVIARRPFEQSG